MKHWEGRQDACPPSVPSRKFKIGEANNSKLKIQNSKLKNSHLGGTQISYFSALKKFNANVRSGTNQSIVKGYFMGCERVLLGALEQKDALDDAKR